jgi:hypothetical protein
MMTKPLVKFFRLPSEDRRLFLRSLWLIGTVRTWLTFLPFSTVRRLTSRRLKVQPSASQPDILLDVEHDQRVDRVAWAIQSASRLIPGATCLTQALAGRILLARLGEPSVVRIGVAKGNNGFEAHAWVENRGRILIGATSRHDFVALPQPHDELL